MFSDETIENAWMRSRAQCECRRKGHGHRTRCTHKLEWEERGQANERGGWEAYRKGSPSVGGWEAVNQSEILCWTCYRQTLDADALLETRPNDSAA